MLYWDYSDNINKYFLSYCHFTFSVQFNRAIDRPEKVYNFRSKAKIHFFQTIHDFVEQIVIFGFKTGKLKIPVVEMFIVYGQSFDFAYNSNSIHFFNLPKMFCLNFIPTPEGVSSQFSATRQGIYFEYNLVKINNFF